MITDLNQLIVQVNKIDIWIKKFFVKDVYAAKLEKYIHENKHHINFGNDFFPELVILDYFDLSIRNGLVDIVKHIVSVLQDKINVEHNIYYTDDPEIFTLLIKYKKTPYDYSLYKRKLTSEMLKVYIDNNINLSEYYIFLVQIIQDQDLLLEMFQVNGIKKFKLSDISILYLCVISGKYKLVRGILDLGYDLRDYHGTISFGLQGFATDLLTSFKKLTGENNHVQEDDYFLHRLRNMPNYAPYVKPIKHFYDNPDFGINHEIAKTIVHLDRHLEDLIVGKTFLLFLLIQDGYFTIKQHVNLERFIKIFIRLPIELQMVLTLRGFSPYNKQIIPSKNFDIYLRRIFNV